MLSSFREQWFSNIRADVLAGLVVGLALIPEQLPFQLLPESIRKSVYMLHFLWQ